MKIIRCLASLLFVSETIARADDIVVTTAADELNQPAGERISLREATHDAGDGPTRICFDASLSNAVITLNPALGALRVLDPDGATAPSFTGLLTIDGSDLDLPPRISAPGLDEDDIAALVVEDRPVALRGTVVEESGHMGISVASGLDLTLRNVAIR